MSRESVRVIGGFGLEKELGHGAQGGVWRARSQLTGQLVALKLFPLGVDTIQADEVRRRVQREVKALSALRLPSIVKLLSHGEQDDSGTLNTGFIWVAYELVAGVNVQNALEASFPPQPSDVLGLLERLAPDLKAAHDAGLVHRDVKPANILLRNNEWTEPVLVDFGYVKPILTAKLTATGFAVGTAGYVAPEVLKSPSAASPSSDLWSLARVTAEALAVSFGAEAPESMQEPSPSLLERLVAPKASSAADALARALAADPAARPADVLELASEIRASLFIDGHIDGALTPEPPAIPWDKSVSLARYLADSGFETHDKRHRPGGCLWIVAGQDGLGATKGALAPYGIDLTFAVTGSKTTDGRPAWWTKSQL